jgi:hypothetical protein
MDGLSNRKLKPSEYPYHREVVNGKCTLCERVMPLENLTYMLCHSCLVKLKRHIKNKLGWYNYKELPLAIKEFAKDRVCRFCNAAIPFMKGDKYNLKINDICDTCIIPYKAGLQAGYAMKRRKRFVGHTHRADSIINNERMNDVSFI